MYQVYTTFIFKESGKLAPGLWAFSSYQLKTHPSVDTDNFTTFTLQSLHVFGFCSEVDTNSNHSGIYNEENILVTPKKIILTKC